MHDLLNTTISSKSNSLPNSDFKSREMKTSPLNENTKQTGIVNKINYNEIANQLKQLEQKLENEGDKNRGIR